MPVFWLPEDEISFPPPHLANEDGILAIGGDLSPERLVLAYQLGIFPWFNEGEPIIWWCPDPRFVLFPEHLRVSKSMRPYFNQRKFNLTFDENFELVMRNCQRTYRKGQSGKTWITEEMIEGYVALHRLGFAHSVEVWDGNELIGGLYGLSLGKIFYGESMFSKEKNASKFGFIALVRLLNHLKFWLVDCQQETSHLRSLGAKSISREVFLNYMDKNKDETTHKGNWSVYGKQYQEILYS